MAVCDWESRALTEGEWMQVYAVATMDTKGEELAYVARCLAQAGVSVATVDVGVLGPPACPADISRSEVLGGLQLPNSGDRGDAVSAMSGAVARLFT